MNQWNKCFELNWSKTKLAAWSRRRLGMNRMYLKHRKGMSEQKFKSKQDGTESFALQHRFEDLSGGFGVSRIYSISGWFEVRVS